MKVATWFVVFLLAFGVLASEEKNVILMSEAALQYTPMMSFADFMGPGHLTGLSCGALQDAIDLSEIKFFSCDETTGCVKAAYQSDINQYRHLFETNSCHLN